ncbi:hypothetical protein Q428_08950 [Fervidicella metallireducens AeB]|uniref:Uncharacterized protein n=1 Tax=Fervidicella metallireducens AeB TaxID=1403537 RepID=A0A017RU87_9CLOT|nr:hypothetical protein Q428_08950 [Fervidicella metallireducens AeB]
MKNLKRLITVVVTLSLVLSTCGLVFAKQNQMAT